MSVFLVIFLVLIAGLAGVAFGYFLRFLLTIGKRGSLEMEIKQKLLDAQEEANRISEKAEGRAEKLLEDARKEAKEREAETKKTEERLVTKEQFLDKRQTDLDQESDELKKKTEEIQSIQVELEKLKEEHTKKLQDAAQLSVDDAREQLFAQIEKDYEEDVLVRMRKLETIAKERLDAKARDILVSSIHRYGNSVASDIMSTSMSIPSDDVKGKIIGKEGRNIRAFERASGVELIIDDTPETVIISSFDPVRRAVARRALEMLIEDGRIQPARIEEFVEKARNEINETIKKEGENAAFEVGVYELDPRILSILGRLHFRTSYGQNVLRHSVEMAHIAGMIAEQIGADVDVAKAAALVHDIGKAVDHEIPGTHVDIGIRILNKFGARQEIIDAMKAHHEEYPYETVESIIVQVADAISGSRPGARSDSIENYLKRLQELEALADGVEGVEKAYAIQAGREIRVFVSPEDITDLEAHKLAQDLARKIEQELRYPGEIKVHVIRESRVVEYAR